ncbi:MAG: hypothetical protein JOZ05_10680, partial [Acetobacteraceae bacterium]|nr:hypothetical protein [Acetobacteraceae bacterium]
ACHNLYIGNAGKLIFRYNVTRRATLGHLLKCRAMVSEIHDNRFFDGLGGSASCNIDLPNGGQATIQNNVFVKGAMAMNPYCIQYGAEGVSASLNTLVVQNNTIAVETLAGSHYGTPSAVAYYHLINANGQGSSAQITNNALWLSPQSTSYTTFNSAPAGAVTETGTTSLTLPPTLDMTRPYLSGTLPILGTLYRHTLYGQDDFQNFEGVLQLQDREQIVVPHTATPGAVLCTVTAHSDLVSGAEQFGSGTTWAIVTDPVYYSVLNPNPWAPAGRYAIGTNADGTGTLSVAGTLASGVDWVQLRATAPNGTTLCDSRYPILVA